MRRRDFIDPLGKLPALEACEIRLRALQFVLALFYAEDLKRYVLDLIQTTDDMGRRLNIGGTIDRVPPGTRNSVGKALAALVTDKAITEDEKKEIVGLIDYRNNISHQVHNLLGDVGTRRSLRDFISARKGAKYRHDAVARLKHYRQRLSGLYRTHHYVRHIGFDRLLFEPAEQALSTEIKRLSQRLQKLVAKRKVLIGQLNSEMQLKGSGINQDLNRYIVFLQYDNGRLTNIGAEICYRLFDTGRSPMAVAHILDISLAAASKRRQSWLRLGGKNRAPVDLSGLSRPKIKSRYDD